MILVLDCETTGLPKDYQAPVTDLDNWPRVVQIAWATFENDGREIESHNFIIRPHGFIIPPEATAKHGITQEMAMEVGSELPDVLVPLKDYLAQVDFVVAHNIDFDASVLGAEYLRYAVSNPFDGKRLICTMKESTEYCAIGSGRNGQYKWPKLSELFATLFPGEEILKEHDAGNDVATCARCFFKLVELGVIVIPSGEIFALPQGSDIQKLAQVRQTLAGLQATKQTMLDTVLKDVVYIGIEKQITDMKGLQDALDANIRAAALGQYLKDQNKHPGSGVEIKVFPAIEHGAPEAIREWCLHNFTPALSVNYKVFDKAALDGNIPKNLATVRDEPRAQIAQDLSEFLPVPVKEGDDIPF